MNYKLFYDIEDSGRSQLICALQHNSNKLNPTVSIVENFEKVKCCISKHFYFSLEMMGILA